MKALPTHPVPLKTLYRFECPPLGHSILLAPQLGEAEAKSYLDVLPDWGRRSPAMPVGRREDS
jgi:hypothetical protein